MSARLFLLLGVGACTASSSETGQPPSEEDEAHRIVVALEEEGAVAVLDEGGVLGTISLSDGDTQFDVHNVQGDPDGRTAWVTAMPRGHDMEGMGEEQLVGIDTVDLTVTRRIALGSDLHVAHVVTDGVTAWVTARDADAILEVDLGGGSVTRLLALPAGSGPHGLRRTPDGARLIVAAMDGGALQVVDLASGGVTTYDVGGVAVQAAVLPDGSAAFVSVYDTRRIARLSLEDDEIELFELPAGAAGPLQIYPTPDGAALWIADQGYLGDDPAGDSLYRMDAASGEVTLTAEVSAAPHGVVMDAAGATVWTTTLVDGTVDRIDAATGELLGSTPVGDGPNGVSCMHPGGAMP